MDRLLLVAHVLGVVLWLGPSLGAWWVYLRASRSGLGVRAAAWFEQVVRLEHAGLLLVLATGAVMVVRFGFWPPPPWLAWKLALVALVVVPIEAADAYVSHVWLPRALQGGDPEAAVALYDRFLVWAGAPLVAAALVVLALAVAKPAV